MGMTLETSGVWSAADELYETILRQGQDIWQQNLYLSLGMEGTLPNLFVRWFDL